MSKIAPLLKEIGTEGILIPICGAGLSHPSNISGSNKKNSLPTWSELVTRLQSKIGETPGVEVSVAMNDYITALTLLQKAHPTEFKEEVDTIFDPSNTAALGRGSLPIHMAIWCLGAPMILTTNYDDLLERARGQQQGKDIARSLSYRSPNLRRVFKTYLKQDNPDYSPHRSLDPLVFHLHGMQGDLTSNDKPLLLWQDYFRAYGFDTRIRDGLMREIERSADRVAADKNLLNRKSEYLTVVKSLLEESSHYTSSTGQLDGTQLPEILRDLFQDYTLLLIGFSLSEPFWRHIFSQMLAAKGGTADRTHFFVTTDRTPVPPLPGFKPIQLDNYTELYPLLNELTAKLHESEKPGFAKEKISRELKYLNLRADYPDLDWIFSDHDSLVPFVELFHNSTKQPIPISINVVANGYQPFDIAIRDQYFAYYRSQREKKNMKVTNEVKVNVNDWKELSNGLSLTVSSVEYKDYLFSNHLVANFDERQLLDVEQNDPGLAQSLRNCFSVDNRFSPRASLCPDEDSIRLHDAAKCSNHLGVSALIIGRYEINKNESMPVIFCPPSTSQVSSPNDVIPSVSGSVDWPVRPDAQSESDVHSVDEVQKGDLLDIDRDVRREFIEECRSNLVPAEISLGERHRITLLLSEHQTSEVISNEILMSFCQNIERGGKPELFYLYTLKNELTMNDFLENVYHPNWELDVLWTPIFSVNEKSIGPPGLRKVFLIPSPIDLDLNPAENYLEHFKLIYEILNNPGYNPVLRAHLATLLLYSNRIFASNPLDALPEDVNDFISSF